MRLIDADALAKFIDYGHLNNPDEKLYSENDIREMIDMMPSIDVVKQGRWKCISFLTVECSECKAQIHDLECSNFCHNCGADMRERKEE